MNNKPTLPRSQIGGENNDDTVGEITEEILNVVEQPIELTEVTKEVDEDDKKKKDVKEEEEEEEEAVELPTDNDYNDTNVLETEGVFNNPINKLFGGSQFRGYNLYHDQLSDTSAMPSQYGGMNYQLSDTSAMSSQYGGMNYQLSEFTTSATSATPGNATLSQYGGNKNDQYYQLKYLKYKTKVMKLRSQL